MHTIDDYDNFLAELVEKIKLEPEKKIQILEQEMEKTTCPFLIERLDQIKSGERAI